MGTLAAYNMSQNYKSLLQVIHELDFEKQKKMFDVVQNVVSGVDISDVIKFGILLTTNQSIKQLVICEVINFVRNELSMQIAQN